MKRRNHTDLYLVALCAVVAFLLLFSLPYFNEKQCSDYYWHEEPKTIEVSVFNDTVVMVEKSNSWWGLGAVSSVKIVLQTGLQVVTNYTVTNATFNPIPTLDLLFDLNETVTVKPLNYTVTELTFNGNLDVQSGQPYQISYELKTFRDNNTKVTPLSIGRVAG
jgi:hypothetical protein